MKDFPALDRPMEKLVRYGVGRLSLQELLALILGSGTKKSDVMKLSQAMLKRFPEETLINVTYQEFKSIYGIGPMKAAKILAVLEFGKRIFERKKIYLILQPKDVWCQLEEIRNSRKEYFVVFYLDVRNQIIRKEIVSMGNLNTGIVHPREVFEVAVRYTAAQILISHNHPSGDCSPSDDDISLTKRLIEAGKILGISIIDHVVVSSDAWYSFKQHSLF